MGYSWAAGYNVGGVYFTPLNEGAGGALTLEFDPGWIVGLQFEHWFGSGRVGARANGAITERPLSLDGRDPNIGIWIADADVMLRFLPADSNRTFNMFLSAGVGGTRYKLGDGEFLNLETANASYPGDDDVRFAVSGGLGLDYITSWRWDGQPVGIRFEVVDNVVLESPFNPISGGDFSPIHNVRFVIGAFSGFGTLR
jgi:hypothetical protein